MSTSMRRQAGRRNSKRIAAVAAFALALGVASGVNAESTAASTVAQIKLVAPGDALYKLYHGALWLTVDKADHNYKWGGQQCGSVTLTEAHINLLIAAFDNKHSVVLDFEEHTYKGRSYRCISAISVRR